jgi:hypothetical protein
MPHRLRCQFCGKHFDDRRELLEMASRKSLPPISTFPSSVNWRRVMS